MRCFLVSLFSCMIIQNPVSMLQIPQAVHLFGCSNLLTEEDLYGRTLMVGGGSPAALRAVQQRLIASGKIDYFNSPDHDTTLTNVAAGRGVCLAPG